MPTTVTGTTRASAGPAPHTVGQSAAADRPSVRAVPETMRPTPDVQKDAAMTLNVYAGCFRWRPQQDSNLRHKV